MERETNYNRLVRMLGEEARRKRALLAEGEVIMEIKETLNRVFGDRYNQISNINEHTALSRMMEKCGIDAAFWEQENLDFDHWLEMAKQHLLYGVTLHFPETTITNSLDQVHTIRDLYVRFFVTPEGRLARFDEGFIWGLRSTGTVREISHGYHHSHLPVFPWENAMFLPFCTGVGPIIAVFCDLAAVYDKAGFELFCYHIKELIKWESLEGNPYIALDQLYSGTQGDELPEINYYPVYYSLLMKLSAFPLEEIVSLFHISILENKITVGHTADLEAYLVRLMEADPELNVLRNFAVRNAQGAYLPAGDVADIGQVDTARVLLKFNNQDIRLKILTYEDEEQTDKRYPHPEITCGICRTIEMRFNKYWFGRQLLVPRCTG